jgi:hypothetical protein
VKLINKYDKSKRPERVPEARISTRSRQGPEKYTEISRAAKVWRVQEGLSKYEESQIIWKSTGGCV